MTPAEQARKDVEAWWSERWMESPAESGQYRRPGLLQPSALTALVACLTPVYERAQAYTDDASLYGLAMQRTRERAERAEANVARLYERAQESGALLQDVDQSLNGNGLTPGLVDGLSETLANMPNRHALPLSQQLGCLRVLAQQVHDRTEPAEYGEWKDLRERAERAAAEVAELRDVNQNLADAHNDALALLPGRTGSLKKRVAEVLEELAAAKGG